MQTLLQHKNYIEVKADLGDSYPDNVQCCKQFLKNYHLVEFYLSTTLLHQHI